MTQKLQCARARAHCSFISQFFRLSITKWLVLEQSGNLYLRKMQKSIDLDTSLKQKKGKKRSARARARALQFLPHLSIMFLGPL